MLRNKTVLILLSLFTVIGILTTPSCRKKDKPEVIITQIAPYGGLTVQMNNEVDGQPITFGVLNYTNAQGNRYQIDLLKYFMSNFTLVRDDNTEINFKNHELIDASDTSTCHFQIDSIPNGNYTAIKFNLGIDSAHNHSGLQEGDLDPISGMIWMWKTGYIFFKHEGKFIDDTGAKTLLLYHYGTDLALATVQLPISKFAVSGNNHTLSLKFNLNALYANPTMINFNRNNEHQSTAIEDVPWINTMKRNFPQAFIFDKVK